MSTHTIHGVTVEIRIHQGSSMTDVSRGRCIGKVVNLCRDLPADEFLAAIEDWRAATFGGPRSAALLAKLDNALETGYHKRYTDDFPPIVALNEVRG